MSNRSTPLNQLPSVANSNPLPSIDEQTENAKLVQDVLNEVEMSRQSSETGYAPQHMSQQYGPPQGYMSPPAQPQHLGETYGQNYSGSANSAHTTKESSFLGITISDLKQMMIIFILFLLFNLQFVVDLIGKYLYFTQHDSGFTTILGIVFRSAIIMLLFLILKKIF